MEVTYDALKKRVAELEAALQKQGCARDQTTTQYCADVVERDKRIAELEKENEILAGSIDVICNALNDAGQRIFTEIEKARAALIEQPIMSSMSTKPMENIK